MVRRSRYNMLHYVGVGGARHAHASKIGVGLTIVSSRNGEGSGCFGLIHLPSLLHSICR